MVLISMQFKISVVSITRWMIGWRDSCVKILHNLLGCVTFHLKSSTMVYFTLYAHHPHIWAKHDVGISNTLISFWSLLNPESEKLFAVLRITRWLPSTHFAFFLSFFLLMQSCISKTLQHFSIIITLYQFHWTIFRIYQSKTEKYLFLYP